MSVQSRRLICAAACALAFAGRVNAHDFWFEPSSLHPAVGDRVAIRMRVGERLTGEIAPRNPYLTVRLDLVDPAGVVTPAPAVAGSDAAAVVAPKAAGLHWVLYQSERSAVELEPAKFADYLALEGLEKIVKERARRGESERIAREAFSRSAKTAVCAGAAGDAVGSSSGTLAPQGLTLELAAETDPCAFVAGGEARFRLLFHGKPLEGALVQALRRDRVERPEESDPPLSARSDRAGRVRFRLDRPGFWLVKAVEMVRADGLPDVEWESFWSSLTFELQPATPSPSSP